MVLNPANYFQLLEAEDADFNLGANGDNLSPEEETLWHNIELYARLIKEAGLESELKEAYQRALRDYTDTENERAKRYSER